MPTNGWQGSWCMKGKGPHQTPSAPCQLLPSAPPCPRKPLKATSLRTRNLALFTRYLGTDGIIASQANFFTSFKNFITESGVLKDLHATEDCKTKVEIQLLLEFCPKTLLPTFRPLSQPTVCPPLTPREPGSFITFLGPRLVLTNNSPAGPSHENFPQVKPW